jgi:NADPH:quinone reductase-like Zn-dependent oxidoreductase
MRAAMVEDFSRPPRYGETSLPVANEGEVLLQVRAAALSNLVRSQANGLHYSSVAAFPFTPGNDGVGIVPEDGSRVYFIAPRAPFGSMAEYSVVSRAMTIPVPANIDDADAAALGNPGLATWGSLLGRAKFQAGEAVLINGATGIAGRQAVQVAKYLGASRIIATGRNEQALAEVAVLGADETISLVCVIRRTGCSGLLVGIVCGTNFKGGCRPWIARGSAAHPFRPDRIDQWRPDHLARRAAAQLRC